MGYIFTVAPHTGAWIDKIAQKTHNFINCAFFVWRLDVLHIDFKTLKFDVDREKCRRDLREFFRQAWPILEPGRELHWGWHLDVIGEALMAMSRHEILKLIINLPPGFSKSLFCSVMWPAWMWIDYPEFRFLTSSYSVPLATRDAVKSRNVLRSDWFRKRWGPKSDWGKSFRLVGDINQKSRYENSFRGFRLAVSIGGSATGERADGKIIDDPLKTQDAYSDAALVAAKNFVSDVWSTRNNDPTRTLDLVVMQRLNRADVSGYLLSEIGGYEHLIIPMRKTKTTHTIKVLGDYDPRKEPGELLDPIRFPLSVVESEEKKLGTHQTASQFQQDPKDSTSALVKFSYFKFWLSVNSTVKNTMWVDLETETGQLVTCEVLILPDKFDLTVQSWDFSFGGKSEGSSRVAGHVYQILGETYYLVDRVSKHMSFTEMISAVKMISTRWPGASRKLYEAKANGPAVANSLRESLSGLVGVTPKESKVARLHAALPTIESGNVILPHPDDYPWVRELVQSLVDFPHGEYDDDTDSLTQVINWRISAPKISIT